MFRSAVIKLTLWYLLIIMFISLCFSTALYSVATHDLEQNFRRQGEQFLRFGISPYQFEQARLAALEEMRQREILGLIRFNFVVFIIAGGASYFLARRTLRPLEQAMEAQSRFTGDASHELRTPLTAMRSEIEVALRSPKLSASEAQDLLRSNLEEVIKLEALSQALLQLARFSDGSGSLEVTELDLTEPVKAAVGRVEKSAAARGITIDVQLKHISIKANAGSLTELFVTLLDNAVKYGHDGGHISITMKAVAGDAIITVTDDGIGIKADDLPYIFDRFYRADSSRTKNINDGYGLGLALAAQIAHIHHGSIEAKSRAGKGSTFVVRLPLAGRPLHTVTSKLLRLS